MMFRSGHLVIALIAACFLLSMDSVSFPESPANESCECNISSFLLSPSHEMLAVTFREGGGNFDKLLIYDFHKEAILEIFRAPAIVSLEWSSDGKELFFRGTTRDFRHDPELKDMPQDRYVQLFLESQVIYRYDFAEIEPIFSGKIVYDIQYSRSLSSLVITALEGYFFPGEEYWKRHRPDFWLLDPKKGSLRRITFQESLSGSWLLSEDGGTAYYTVLRGERIVPMAIDLNSAEKELLSLGDNILQLLAISKDSGNLVVKKSFGDDMESPIISQGYIYDLMAGAEKRILNGNLFIAEAVFSEDGKKLALFAKGPNDGKFHVYIAEDERGALRKITSDGPPSAGNGTIAWYDNDTVLYTDCHDIFMVNIISGEKKSIYDSNKVESGL